MKAQIWPTNHIYLNSYFTVIVENLFTCKIKLYNMGLSDCLSKYVGTWITPPRNKAFDIQAQRYHLNKMNHDENYLEIQFESGTTLRVHY
jgi:hypothetical protein